MCLVTPKSSSCTFLIRLFVARRSANESQDKQRAAGVCGVEVVSSGAASVQGPCVLESATHVRLLARSSQQCKHDYQRAIAAQEMIKRCETSRRLYKIAPHTHVKQKRANKNTVKNGYRSVCFDNFAGSSLYICVQLLQLRRLGLQAQLAGVYGSDGR